MKPATGMIATMALMASYGVAQAETIVVTAHLPATHWAITEGIEPLLACATAAAPGAFEANFFPGGQISSSRGTLDALQAGLAQMAYIPPSHLSDVLPLNNIPILPNMGRTVTDMVRAYRAVVDDAESKIAQELARHDLVPILINMFPPYQVGMKGTALTAMADFTGKKILVGGGAQNAAVEAVNGTSVQMSSADAYVGVQQGTVDGYIMSFASVSAYSLEEVTGSISDNANFAASSGLLAMNRAVFEGLAPEVQTAVTDCGLKVEADLAAFEEEMTQRLEEEFAGRGVEVYSFPDDVLSQINERLETATLQYLQRIEDLGHSALAAYEEYRAALGD